MRHMLKLSVILGVFVFGVAFGLVGDGLTWTSEREKSIGDPVWGNLAGMSGTSKMNRKYEKSLDKQTVPVLSKWLNDGCPEIATPNGLKPIYSAKGKYPFGGSSMYDAQGSMLLSRIHPELRRKLCHSAEIDRAKAEIENNLENVLKKSLKLIEAVREHKEDQEKFERKISARLGRIEIQLDDIKGNQRRREASTRAKRAGKLIRLRSKVNKTRIPIDDMSCYTPPGKPWRGCGFYTVP